MTSLRDSNYLTLTNTWNTAKTAAASTDIAKSNRMLVQGMRHMIMQQEIGNELLQYNAAIAVENNRELKSIGNTLNGIGFVLNDLLSSSERQVATLERQEALHKEHYDSVKKEKALKEVLYNLKKFQDTLHSVNDPIAEAYGSKIFLKMLEARDFGTKDLSEIADK